MVEGKLRLRHGGKGKPEDYRSVVAYGPVSLGNFPQQLRRILGDGEEGAISREIAICDPIMNGLRHGLVVSYEGIPSSAPFEDIVANLSTDLKSDLEVWGVLFVAPARLPNFGIPKLSPQEIICVVDPSLKDKIYLDEKGNIQYKRDVETAIMHHVTARGDKRRFPFISLDWRLEKVLRNMIEKLQSQTPNDPDIPRPEPATLAKACLVEICTEF